MIQFRQAGKRIYLQNESDHLYYDDVAEFMLDEALYTSMPNGARVLVVTVLSDSIMRDGVERDYLAYYVNDRGNQKAYKDESAIEAIVAHLKDLSALKARRKSRLDALKPDVALELDKSKISANATDIARLTVYRRVGVGALPVRLSICFNGGSCASFDLQISETPQVLQVSADTPGTYSIEALNYGNIVNIQAG